MKALKELSIFLLILLLTSNSAFSQISLQCVKQLGGARYLITNLQGRTVAEKQVTATRLLRLNQLPLAPGIYLMEVTTQAGKKYKGKVLKLND